VPGCECEDFAALAREVRWSDPTLSAEAVREKLAENGIGVTAEQVAEARGDVRKKQVGGDHYAKRTIQPWDIWKEYGLDPWRANAIKYLLRAGTKDGVPALQDLKKALHYVEECVRQEEHHGGE
jgi:hypothetical protein